ncbi:hypothetical protein [Massilia timonae]|uniref:hypothetical protein n=1 Tax=Massilia timonae TaxID=47229 RepID=UPI00289A8609|nr:hypothetical protein [Massilia timonae]
MQNVQEQQRLVDTELVQAMIESTPESWEQIVLTLTRASLRATGQVPGQSDFGNFHHELLSPQGHAPVGPADSLFAATYKLDELLQDAKGFLVKAVYVAKQEGGSWTYKADFEYE